MANSYVKISSKRGEIRTFGGNRSAVLSMAKHYKDMTLGEFMFKHQHLTKEDYDTLSIDIYRKR